MSGLGRQPHHETFAARHETVTGVADPCAPGLLDALLRAGVAQDDRAVAVDADVARRLAAALAAGDITVVRSTGAPSIEDVTWYEPPTNEVGTDA